jgi:hypothetical protein
MSDGIGKLRLQSRLQPKRETPWSIIDELATVEESELLRLLRPHTEMHFSDDQQGTIDKDRRRRVDVALGTLTILEIAHQVGVVEAEPAPQVENLKKLFQSEAFLPYVNAYLYFGIRFLAWRITPPEWADPQTSKGERTLNSNKRPFPLITPPQLANDDRADSGFAKLNDLAMACDPAINPKDSTAQVQSLTFLDGFTNDPPEDSAHLSGPERFELWLRGLYPELTGDEQKRFPAIRQGLTD